MAVNEDSILAGVVTLENQFTQLLANIMNANESFALKVLKIFTRSDANHLRGANVETQPTLPDGCGRPDIRVVTRDFCLLVEVKVDPLRGLELRERPGEPVGYEAHLLRNWSSGHRCGRLIYLVPSGWAYMEQVDEDKVVLWAEILPLIPRKTVLYRCVYRLFIERFGPVVLSRETLRAMYGRDFPTAAMFDMIGFINNIRGLAGRGRRRTFTAIQDGGELGFTFEKHKYFFGSALEVWVATGCPFCIGMKSSAKPKQCEAFARNVRDQFDTSVKEFGDWIYGGIPEVFFNSKNPDNAQQTWLRISKVVAATERAAEADITPQS